VLRAVLAALAVAVAYVFGTFPSADLAAHLHSGGTTDIRTLGSGNPGAANVRTELGSGWGLFVLVLDMAKGLAACGIARWMIDGNAASIAGIAAVVGHCFPLWNGFRGGKGVATGGGQLLATLPAGVPVVAFGAFIGSKVLRGTRSVRANLGALAGWVIGAALWWALDLPNLWGPEPTGALLIGAAGSSAVILYRFATAKEPASAV
jgi:acyl phosphate:glycerol-3-phosphate acyltransferase